MDKSMIADMESLPEADKQRMANMIDQLGIRDRLRMYNNLVERCFHDCVDTLKHKSLQKQEETCVRRCTEKFLKHTMRVGMRFAELNQGAATVEWIACQSFCSWEVHLQLGAARFLRHLSRISNSMSV